MCDLLDVLIFNSMSYEQQHQFIPDKLRSGSFSVQLEPRALSPGAASPGNTQSNCALQESSSSVIGFMFIMFVFVLNFMFLLNNV